MLRIILLSIRRKRRGIEPKEINSLVEYDQFFMFIGFIACSIFVAILFFLEEPAGQIAEILPDGTVEMINIK